jgi:hypothetical protein
VCVCVYVRIFAMCGCVYVRVFIRCGCVYVRVFVMCVYMRVLQCMGVCMREFCNVLVLAIYVLIFTVFFIVCSTMFFVSFALCSCFLTCFVCTATE